MLISGTRVRHYTSLAYLSAVHPSIFSENGDELVVCGSEALTWRDVGTHLMSSIGLLFEIEGTAVFGTWPGGQVLNLTFTSTKLVPIQSHFGQEIDVIELYLYQHGS